MLINKYVFKVSLYIEQGLKPESFMNYPCKNIHDNMHHIFEPIYVIFCNRIKNSAAIIFAIPNSNNISCFHCVTLNSLFSVCECCVHKKTSFDFPPECFHFLHLIRFDAVLTHHRKTLFRKVTKVITVTN